MTKKDKTKEEILKMFKELLDSVDEKTQLEMWVNLKTTLELQKKFNKKVGE